jgi:hypothetical protein
MLMDPLYGDGALHHQRRHPLHRPVYNVPHGENTRDALYRIFFG